MAKLVDISPSRAYLAASLLLAVACLWPIWALDFPALQDYPQHLFLAQVNATFDSPLYNWRDFYQVALRPGPYVVFYGIVVLLSKVMPLLVAGKLFLSCYIAWLAGIAALMPALTAEDSGNPPWGSLLLFPFAFHQMYFMGFTNFLLSLPLLLAAFLDHRRFGVEARPTWGSWLGHAAIVLLVFLCHPYTILVYICLTFGSALLPAADGRRSRLAWVPPGLAAALFVLWYLLGPATNHGRMPLVWWSWPETLRYFLLPFTGMRWGSGPHWPTLVAWLAALGVVGWGLVRRRRQGLALPRRLVLAWGLATLGFFVLPFWAGQYSYFNLRLAPVSYLLAALVAGFALLPTAAGLLLAGLLAFLVVQSAVLQTAVARETAELRPLLSKMAPNAKLLPMTFRTDSKVLDRHFFPEAHSHDYFYYHLLVGGGASPSLFPSPMLPVAFKPGVDLPLATHGFSWQEQGAHYDYILTRGAPPEFAPFIGRYAVDLGRSGDWQLFKNPKRQ